MATARNFFTIAEQQQIVEAIAEAEKNTSGEIRLHLETLCLGNELEAAKKIFTKLKMHETRERNGVLIYIATMSHKIAVIGDEGIHQRLGTEFWDQLVKKLIAQFRAHKKAEALSEAIIECGKQLGHYFPRLHDDQDELNNSISY